MFGSTVSSRAWAEVVSHDARFEFPDVIGFADGGPDGAGWDGGPWAAEGRLHRPAFVAKRDGSLRRLAVVDPAVHARYRSVVAGVAGAVERSLGDGVGGGRCLAVGRRLVVEPWRRGWRRHERRVRRLSSGRGVLVGLDVRDCFGSIRPEALIEALGRCGADRGAASAVHRLLARLEDDGVAGLPVGPEPSAVLANAVLGSADRSLRSQGYAFARWCDDVVVRTASGDVAAVHEAWAAALHPLGLRPAPEKSRVVEPGELLRASRPGHVARRPLAGEPDLPGKGTPAGCVGRRSPSARIVRSLCERAAGAAEGPDPHLARVELARVAMLGERHARAALRHARSRAPYLRATVDWGLRR